MIVRNNMNKILLRVGTHLQRIKPSTQPKFLTSICRNLSDTKDSEDMDQFKDNPYFAKYQDKLKKVYDENPEKFLDNLKNKKVEKIGNPEDYGIKLNDKVKTRMSSSTTKKRTLDTIMKLDKVKDLERDAIKAIWTTFLSELDKYPGMINAEEYELVAQRSSKFNTFLFPLPREQGYEFILAQWSGPECYFTPLINFQAHGANAPSIMTIVYFDELLDSKNVSLEMTEVDSNNLKPEEAKFLIHLMRSYYIYAKEDDEKFSLMKRFTNEPDKFDHMDTIEILKNDKMTVDQFKGITDIEEATKGILERVQKPVEKKTEPVKEDRYKEKDLADFS